MKTLLSNRTVRKGLVDIGLAGIGFAVVGVTLLLGNLDPELASGISASVGAAAATGRRLLRDWAHGPAK